MLKNKKCECTALLFQDVRATDLSGQLFSKLVLEKIRNIRYMPIAPKLISQEQLQLLYIKTGRLVRSPHFGAVASYQGTEILLISAYLPTNLDLCGAPLLWDIEDDRKHSLSQQEAHGIYSTLLEWTGRFDNWVIGGDLNETRSPLDSVRINEFKVVPKFIDDFLGDSQGIDIWRSLYPQNPGFTYRSGNGLSKSR